MESKAGPYISVAFLGCHSRDTLNATFPATQEQQMQVVCTLPHTNLKIKMQISLNSM